MNNIYFVRVKGNINKFLLKCNINIIRIKYVSQREIIIKIKKDDYNNLLKLYGYNFKVINKNGIEKIKIIFKKYRIFIFSFLIGLVLLISLSNIIFDINININNKELRDIICKELANYGIEKYRFKKSFRENNNIKNKIKEKYKDSIEWIEITNIGTKVNVNIIERKTNNKDYKEEEKYSIVAKKSGFIKKIIVTEGIKVVNENNYVNKGDIIISSDIYLNDNLKDRVTANGKVYASVWYKVICEYPLNYTEKVYTNKKKKILFIKIGNKYIDLFGYRSFDRKELYSFKDKLTNISLGIEEIEKVNIKQKKYNYKEALKNAKAKANVSIKDRLKKDEYIISQKTLKFDGNGSKIIVEMFFSVYEEISEKRVIEGSDNNG